MREAFMTFSCGRGATYGWKNEREPRAGCETGEAPRVETIGSLLARVTAGE